MKAQDKAMDKATTTRAMLGVGVDIIAISRMKDVLETSEREFIKKVYTAREHQRSETHPDRTAYLAVTFAAKEAIFKTFGIGWDTGVKFTEIEIRDGEHGEPIPVLSGRFAELAVACGVSRVLLSLSWDGDYAIAFAALSGGDARQCDIGRKCQFHEATAIVLKEITTKRG
jgi:phosphopantetheine--protein transferase-like protein